MITIAFLICIPMSESRPSSAMKPKGWSKSSSPATTPTRMSGTVQKMTSGLRMELKRNTVMRNISATMDGSFAKMLALAFSELSTSPPHSTR